jgi:hypothetical protein
VHTYHGTPGLARAGGPAASTRLAPRAFPKTARRLPSGHYSATEAVPSAAAPAAAAATAATATRSPSVNFNGVSSRDSQFTNFEAKFEPPDQALCQGNGFVLEPVNSAYRIYRTNGKSLRGPFNVNDLFNVGGAEFTSDPRCWFDRSTQTWFATILFLNDTFTAGSLLIAVRHSPSPLGLWTQFSIDTTDLGGNGCPASRLAEDRDRPDQPVHHRGRVLDPGRSQRRGDVGHRQGRPDQRRREPALRPFST